MLHPNDLTEGKKKKKGFLIINQGQLGMQERI